MIGKGHLSDKNVKKVIRAQREGTARRVTVSAGMMKILVSLAYDQTRAGDYGRTLRALMKDMKNYSDGGMFDE